MGDNEMVGYQLLDSATSILASIPGRTIIREAGLVSTACECANHPPVSGGADMNV